MFLTRKHKRFSRFISVTLVIFPLLVLALPDDNKQKLYITSDTSIYNYKTGFTLYEGHVKVDQGTTHITANRLVTKTNSLHKIREAIAYGLDELAHYWTIAKAGDPELHANAKIIKFYPIESTITLLQNASVKQGENSFQGELIHYNRNDQTIMVPTSQKGRAVLVYNPDDIVR